MAYTGHMPYRECEIEGCSGKHKGRGYCEKHLIRFRKYGDPLANHSKVKKECSIEGCNKPTAARGWCQMHYVRWKNHGDPHHVTVRVRPTCSVEGCNEPHNAKGYCLVHYMRLKNAGSTDLVNPASLPVEQAFSHYVGPATATGCTEWLGARNRQGYGRIVRGDNQMAAHRVSYELHKGPIPDGLLIRHTCDNPPCVNPDHLLIGTVRDNSQDSIERGRHAHGETAGPTKLNEDQVKEIIQLKGRMTQREIGELYGISREAVSGIHTRRNWKHL